MPSTPNSLGFQRSQYNNHNLHQFKIGRRNRRHDGPNEPDHGLIVSELLLKGSSPYHGMLNSGQEDQMSVTGYRRSASRTAFCWLCVILTFGLLRLILHWWRHWLLLATHSPCPLDVAEKVLVREEYQGKHTVYYVKTVVTLNAGTIKQMREDSKKWENFFPMDETIDEKHFHLSMHFSDGNFKHMDTIRIFRCKQLRYVWDAQTQTFQKLKGLDVNVPSVYFLHQKKGLSQAEQLSRRFVYGSNEIAIPVKTVFTLLFLEVLNPFYVFQVFSVCLWISYNYYYYAIVIVLMSAFGITMSIIQTKKNQQALRSTVQSSDCAIVIHDDGSVVRVESQHLVPGDLIEIPSSGCTMQCDAVLLSGNCILDESMLTGESVPVTKTPLPIKRDLIFDTKEHSRHMLFCGTKVIQTRYIGSEKVLAVVVNTGNITAKGGLIRSILYPPPVDYKFEQDSYKFIALLGLIAGFGFVFTLVTKIMRGISATKIAIESLDLITIAVPPALPAAMTVGRYYAQKRLKRNNIYCISPRSINVSGSIDCVCFDKTGTLTEDGLDMWGVVPKSTTNQFQIPLKQVERLPCDHFLYGMVSCHSITIMGGELKGDPLDLKMFESTGWILEEANVADDNKYDLLFPTIVRQPKMNKSQSGSESCGINNDEDIYETTSNDIGIVREFSFTSTLQRMSVITRRQSDKHFNVYCKGSPEMIKTLCKTNTIPDNYFSQLDIYAQQGYRIIAVAYKPLDKKITYARVQRIGRDKIESDLEFQGFVILENRLKPDTTDVIKSLTSAAIRCVMVTGDNILTALSVAKDCGMITNKQSVITVNARPNLSSPNRYEIFYNLTGANVMSSQSVLLNTPNGVGSELCSLMTNSNSVVSLETVDTWIAGGTVQQGNHHQNNKQQPHHQNQQNQINHRDIELGLPPGTPTTPQNDISIPNSSVIYDDYMKIAPDITANTNNYRFAMVGKTWSIVRDHFPELLPKFVTRGTIFARMSPEQKQSLILELQDLGYYVAMCGDGANDCGALKAAHTGISLSDAESSVASPFTSKNPTIACVPSVIKEGRAALVTSFGVFKYMAAYSLVQFASVLILYSIDSNLTDLEFLYIDLFLISVFAFFFGKTESYDGPLVKETPLSSLISLSPIISLLLHLFTAITFQVIGWYHLQSQTWFVPFNISEHLDDENDLGCYENYTIFIISCFQYIILGIIFSKGAPYRKSIVSNLSFLIALIINTIIVVYLALAPVDYLPADFLQLVVPPDMDFRGYLILYGVLNFLISIFIESIVIEYFLMKKLRYRFHNIEKSRRKFLSIEFDLQKNFKWPPLSYYSNDININNDDNNDKSSPVSYAEIGAEHGIDINQQLFDQNSSVLNSFFVTKSNTEDGDDVDTVIKHNSYDNNFVINNHHHDHHPHHHHHQINNDNIIVDDSDSDSDSDYDFKIHEEEDGNNSKIISNNLKLKNNINNENIECSLEPCKDSSVNDSKIMLNLVTTTNSNNHNQNQQYQNNKKYLNRPQQLLQPNQLLKDQRNQTTNFKTTLVNNDIDAGGGDGGGVGIDREMIVYGKEFSIDKNVPTTAICKIAQNNIKFNIPSYVNNQSSATTTTIPIINNIMKSNNENKQDNNCTKISMELNDMKLS